MAYTADIQIAVRGATQITNLQRQLESTAQTINRVNQVLGSRGILTNSIDNLRNSASQAARAMRSAATGTNAQKQAIDVYVKSLASAQRAEENLTLAIQRRQKQLGIATATTQRQSATGGQGRLGGAVSNAIIGGAFPLLFGQGGGAAAGGAIGGAVGGLFGGAGGFAGSLLGTLLGDLATRGAQIKELAADIGFSAEQTKQLELAFAQAGREADKFQAAVQNIRGIGLSLEDQADAIRLVSSLTETYGGKIDKVANAFTSALETGKVSQSTLNQLTSQGIPIQDALANKYGVSRNAILKMAKDGTISVQTLTDVLVDMGNKGLEAGQKPQSAFDLFNQSLNNTVTAVGNVANALATKLMPILDQVLNKATLVLNSITEVVNTELLRTTIQAQSGKILSPQKLAEIEKEAAQMAARRYPSQARGRQLAAGPNILSPRAQQEFQIIREQLIRNELQRFGFESGILKAPKAAVQQQNRIGTISAPSQIQPTQKQPKERRKGLDQLIGGDIKRQLELRQAALDLDVQQRMSFAQTDQAKRMVDFYAKYRSIANEVLAINETTSAIERQRGALQANGVNVEEKLRDLQNEKQALAYKLNAALQEQYNLSAAAEVERRANVEEIMTSLDMELMKLNAKTDAEKLSVELALLENRLKQQGIILTAQETEAIKKKMEQIAQAQSKQKTMQAEIEAAVNNVGGLFTSTLEALIVKTRSWQDVMRSLLSDIGSILFRLGITMLGGSDGVGFFSILAGTFGKRAGGGAVSSPRPYLVGERGPELFVPNTGGSVVPTNDLRAAMGAGPGSSVGAPVLNMSFETSTINGVEYVSREQLEAAMAATRRQAARDGAQRGMTMTLDRLQQSPNTRRRVGF